MLLPTANATLQTLESSYVKSEKVLIDLGMSSYKKMLDIASPNSAPGDVVFLGKT